MIFLFQQQALIAAASRLTGQEAVQFMVDYGQVYANTQVIAKPPVKTHKESLGSVLDSFYNDIATMEKIEQEPEQVSPVESAPLALQQIAQEVEQPPILTDSVLKERKKKKVFFFYIPVMFVIDLKFQNSKSIFKICIRNLKSKFRIQNQNWKFEIKTRNFKSKSEL